MIALYIVCIFLWVYFDQHGSYLNVFDVMLMAIAGIFILFCIVAMIAAWKDK